MFGACDRACKRRFEILGVVVIAITCAANACCDRLTNQNWVCFHMYDQVSTSIFVCLSHMW